MQEPVLYFFKKKASTNPDLEKPHSHSPNTPWIQKKPAVQEVFKETKSTAKKVPSEEAKCARFHFPLNYPYVHRH